MKINKFRILITEYNICAVEKFLKMNVESEFCVDTKLCIQRSTASWSCDHTEAREFVYVSAVT